MPKPSPHDLVLPCMLTHGAQQRIETLAKQLAEKAPELRPKGMSKKDFLASGAFEAAIERLRGQRAASMQAKRQFLKGILDFLKARRLVADWDFRGSSERHDYELEMRDGRTVVFEAKGCLDGNNTNIFQRPANAEEFYIWSLCQNAGADPRKNAWSGIHTRLGPEIVARRELVDGVVFLDGLCGTMSRPCPKVAGDNRNRLVTVEGVGRTPPPCLFTFPRSVPDPRNNPAPKSWRLSELSFLTALSGAFDCKEDDVTTVKIEVEMEGATTKRRTILRRHGEVAVESRWNAIRRAR